MANFDNQYILKRIVNKNFTFGDFNKYLENTYNANIYCPFHDHSYSGKGNAKLYYDEEQEMSDTFREWYQYRLDEIERTQTKGFFEGITDEKKV